MLCNLRHCLSNFWSCILQLSKKQINLWGYLAVCNKYWMHSLSYRILQTQSERHRILQMHISPTGRFRRRTSSTRRTTFVPEAPDALSFYQTLRTQDKCYRTLQTQGQAYSHLGCLGHRGGNRMKYRTSGDKDFFLMKPWSLRNNGSEPPPAAVNS